MGIKTYKPITPSRRFWTGLTFDELSGHAPEKGLMEKLGKTGGRNNSGKLTCRHKGGGHKRQYRVIDFKRDKWGVPGTVKTVEYDPNRSAFISLVVYADGEKRYIIHADGMVVGDVVNAGPEAEIKVGNALPLSAIPVGSIVHNVELQPKKGAQMARSAGSFVKLMAKEGDHALLRLRSGEVRKVRVECMATMGQVGNSDHGNITIGKAGRSRWLGIRPTVRGVAMNPVDHPHGGGENKSHAGRHPVTPWGKPTKGKKTRKKQPSDRMIVKRRS